MDDGRFDSLVKALAEGKSRRSVLKGLLGLGGAAIVGTAVVESDTDAAVRKTPTPTPVKCPGQQTNVGGVCTCKVPPAPGPNKCGPACCTGKHGDPIPGPPTHTECCDNACCNGTCLGEEGCCPTNTRAGGMPPTNKICDGPNGPTCCLWEQECCLIDGCCDTVCTGGMVGNSYCCAEANFCPGGNESEDLCCEGGTTCCGRGTNGNACVDLRVEGNCCNEGDCEDPFCQVCDQRTHTCGPRCDEETEVCCTEQAGPGICQKGDCCPGAPCPGGGCQECGVDPDTGIAQCTGLCGDTECCRVGLEPPDWFCCEFGTEQCCQDTHTCIPVDETCPGSGCTCPDQDECCFINDVFVGCVDLTQDGACCTAATCGLDDPSQCLVSYCNNFVCEALSSCAPEQKCCDGECIADSACCESTEGPCECLPTSSTSPGGQVPCSTSTECCSGCCADSSATAAEICSVVSPGAQGLCQAYIQFFLTEDICTGTSFEIPGINETVYVSCLGI